jgi:hypothetical protein
MRLGQRRRRLLLNGAIRRTKIGPGMKLQIGFLVAPLRHLSSEKLLTALLAWQQ